MNEKKLAELKNFIVKTKGIINPTEQNDEIALMAANCPKATAEEKGLTTDVDKAYETMLIMQGTAVNPTLTQTPAVSTQPAPMISAQEELQISKTLLQQDADRRAVSANSSVDMLVFDRPAPSEYIKPGTTGMIVEKGWNNLMEKIKDGTYTVMPDDDDSVEADKRIASTTNFNTLKAAFESKTPVEVYIGNLVTKAIGYVIKKGTVTGTAATPERMRKERAEQFVVMETSGYILAGDTKPGLKLRYIKGKVDASNPGKSTQGKTVLADANKKAAIEAGSYVVSREVTSETADSTCKSALQFRVTVKGKFMKDGVTPQTRTIRVSLKSALPVLTRKPEFIDEFGTGEREANGDLLEVPTGDQAAKINDAQRHAIAQLRQKANDPAKVGELAGIEDKLKAFDVPVSQAPSAVM